MTHHAIAIIDMTKAPHHPPPQPVEPTSPDKMAVNTILTAAFAEHCAGSPQWHYLKAPTSKNSVMPAKAGIQNRPTGQYFFKPWIPGFRRNDDVIRDFFLKVVPLPAVSIIPK